MARTCAVGTARTMSAMTSCGTDKRLSAAIATAARLVHGKLEEVSETMIKVLGGLPAQEGEDRK
jgi:hypothetical protein